MRRLPEPEIIDFRQYFDSAFSASPTLNPLSAVPISWRALLPTVLPMWLNRPGPFGDSAGQTEYPLACSRALFPVFYCFLRERRDRPDRFRPHFMNFDDTQIAVGKYLVSPAAKRHSEGQFAASVSIRSGRGSATHDRVMRFSGLFESAAAAIHYATEHALGWIQERAPRACV